MSLSTLTPSTRTALFGVVGMFFSHGFMIAVRAATVPLIDRQLGNDNSALATCLTAMGIGALVSFILAGKLIAWLGSARATLASVGLAAIFFALQPHISNVWTMSTALFFLGMGAALSDIAMNVQASIVEQQAKSSLMTRIHGSWSFGAIAGSVIAGMLIERLSPFTFAIGFAIASVVAAYVSTQLFVNEPSVTRREGKGLGLPPLSLLPVAFMALLTLFTVVGVRDWIPVYMLANLNSNLSLSVQSFAAFQATTALGRLFGDSIRETLGDKILLLGGGVLGALAVAGGLASQNAMGMFAGLAVLGLAHANLFPVLISIAGKFDPGHESRNLSAVMGLASGGFVAGPILIGALANAFGLVIGIAAIAAVSLSVAIATAVPGWLKKE